MKNWFNQHVDTISVLGTLAVGFLWFNSQISDVKTDISNVRMEVKDVQNELGIIKTVLIMQRIMPAELAIHKDDQDNG